MSTPSIEQAYQLAKERYAEIGVNTDEAIEKLAQIPLSLHCWQGDDVGGFEKAGAELSGGGIQVTGHHPGKARSVEELRIDLEKAFSLIPGQHRLNLHAIYGEFGKKFVDRDAIEPEHFQGWVQWAKNNNLALDFNATCFSHPKADSGYTLSHEDASIRNFWIEHVKRCRVISEYMGRELKNPCIHNLWIPDGCKDAAVERWAYRSRLQNVLDEIYAIKHNPMDLKDAVECKLFGIGSEAFVVGSHEFYMGYAISRGLIICLDMGHFHPTEVIADKIPAILQFSKELLLHLSRGIRWDSDHVLILNDDVKAVMDEIVRAKALDRVHFALDFFDGSINRVGAWVVGARAASQALLLALLQPRKKLIQAITEGDGFSRLAWLEMAKTLPFGSVWDYYCEKAGAPAGAAFIEIVRDYEKTITGKRD